MKIGILGAGTWGIALARMLCSSNHQTAVWSALPDEIENLQKTHVHPRFPDITLPKELSFTCDVQEICSENDMLIFAVPSPYIRSVARSAMPFLRENQIIVSVAKGIEASTLFTMTEIIADQLGDMVGEKSIKIACLSGPTHAEEVIRYMPTAILSSCPDRETAEIIQTVFMNTCMRVYTNPDIKGVELCGALKNIIALASGMLSGLGLGDNIKAALITRGMAEIKRLGMKMGCKEQTFYGLAGIGDLIVTALSQNSRNYRAGILIGKGFTPEEAVKEVGMVVEGINALEPAMKLSKKYDIELPIISSVYSVIYEHAPLSDTLYGLMKREKRSELSEFDIW